MRYTIILTPTAKSDIVNLKISLAQQLIDQNIIRKEFEFIIFKHWKSVSPKKLLTICRKIIL